MRFDVVTLFPDLFAPFMAQGITRRAYESGQVDVKLWNLRDHAEGTYRRVDDRPFGGGPGMVMLAEPLERALAAVALARREAGAPAGPVVLFTPTGRRIDQSLVREWAAGPGATLICGRYEGIDQRVVDRHVDVELSLDDFVLSGGEIPALTLLDAIARLMPGVLGDEQSHLQDSFEDGLLDCAHYTRSETEGTTGIPDVLLSGDHAAIRRWRRQQSLGRTWLRRPDLLARVVLSKEDRKLLQAFQEAWRSQQGGEGNATSR